jgi:hypothetical protein
MSHAVFGVVHGRTIELNEELGLSDGQTVEVSVTTVPPLTQWGEGLRRCAGALAEEWTEEDDRILDQLHRERARDTRPEVLE